MLASKACTARRGLDLRARLPRGARQLGGGPRSRGRCSIDAPCPLLGGRAGSRAGGPQSARPQRRSSRSAPTPSRRGAGRKSEEEKDRREEESCATDRRHRLRPRGGGAGREARGALHGGLWQVEHSCGGDLERARWPLNATPGCSSSSRWMYWGNFRRHAEDAGDDGADAHRHRDGGGDHVDLEERLRAARGERRAAARWARRGPQAGSSVPSRAETRRTSRCCRSRSAAPRAPTGQHTTLPQMSLE